MQAKYFLGLLCLMTMFYSCNQSSKNLKKWNNLVKNVNYSLSLEFFDQEEIQAEKIQELLKAKSKVTSKK